MNTLFKHSLFIAIALTVFTSCKKDPICNATKANAGPDQLNLSGLSATLGANTITQGIGSWSIVTGSGGNIDDPLSPAATFTGSAGVAYTLLWTVAGCPVSTDEVQISFSTDPLINGVDKSPVIQGDIIKFTGFNFTANYNGGSQVVASTNGVADVYLPILERTETSITAVVYALSTGLHTVKYSKKPTADPAVTFDCPAHYTVNAPSGFYTSQTFTSTNVNKGGSASFGVKNGSTTTGDYTVKLVAYNYTTGVMTETATTVSSVEAGAYDGMDKVSIAIPGDLAAGSYYVKITFGSTTRIAGWGYSLNVN